MSPFFVDLHVIVRSEAIARMQGEYAMFALASSLTITLFTESLFFSQKEYFSSKKHYYFSISISYLSLPINQTLPIYENKIITIDLFPMRYIFQPNNLGSKIRDFRCTNRCRQRKTCRSYTI